jgi:hypothetical protein
MVGAMELCPRPIPGDLLMIWFFGRDGESLHVEMRYERTVREFSLLIGEPKGDRQERFRNLASCRVRLVELENQLAMERWVRARNGLSV